MRLLSVPFFSVLSLPVFAGSSHPINKWSGDVGNATIPGTVKVPLLDAGSDGVSPAISVSVNSDADKTEIFHLVTGVDLISVTDEFVARHELKVKTHNRKLINLYGEGREYKVGGEIKTVSIETLQVGELVLRDVTAMVISSKGLDLDFEEVNLISLNALTDVATAILPSEGVVQFEPASDGAAMLEGMTGAVRLPYENNSWEVFKFGKKKIMSPGLTTIVTAEIGGKSLPTALSVAGDAGAVGSGANVSGSAEAVQGDQHSHWTEVSFGDDVATDAWFVETTVFQVLPDDVQAIVGSDVLARFDFAIDPANMQVALRPAQSQNRLDARPSVLEQALKDAEEATGLSIKTVVEDDETAENVSDEEAPSVEETATADAESPSETDAEQAPEAEGDKPTGLDSAVETLASQADSLVTDTYAEDEKEAVAPTAESSTDTVDASNNEESDCNKKAASTDENADESGEADAGACEAGAGPWLAVASLKEDLGDLDGALVAYEHALSLDDSSCSTWTSKGKAELSAGDPGAAIVSFTKASELYHAWWDQDRDERLRRDKIADLKAKKMPFYGWAAAFMGEVPEEPQKQPAACHNADGHLAAAYLANGDTDKVEGLYRDRLDLDPILAMAWGSAALAADKIDAAHEPLRQAIKRERSPGKDWRVGLGVAYQSEGDWRTADGHYRRALSIDPHDSVLTALWLDNIRGGLGNAAALRSAKAWAQARPNSGAALYGLAREADLAGNTGALDEVAKAAEGFFPDALAVSPRDGTLWANYARYLVATGDIEGASEAANTAVTVSPAAGVSWLALAEVEGERGEEDKAEEHRKKAFMVEPLHPGLAVQ